MGQSSILTLLKSVLSLPIAIPIIFVNRMAKLVIVEKLYQLVKNVFVFVHRAVLYNCKSTKSNRRLYSINSRSY